MVSPARIADEKFRTAVQRLRVPGAGTEVVAPLLGMLIQLLRPERVLEVGMGYTTPFLAAALAEVDDLVRAESRALADKTGPYLAEGRDLDEAWLHADPPLLAPAFYLQPRRSRFVAVDNLSIPDSSAGQVQEVLRELGLDNRVTVMNADLRDSVHLLPDDLIPIDFAWVDAWECLFFFDHFWERINSDGGVVIMHYLMTYPEGEAIIKYITKFQQANPGELEIVNFLESHKLIQNSLTIIRRTKATTPRRYAEPGGKLCYGDPLRAEATTHTELVGSQTPRPLFGTHR